MPEILVIGRVLPRTLGSNRKAPTPSQSYCRTRLASKPLAEHKQ